MLNKVIMNREVSTSILEKCVGLRLNIISAPRMHIHVTDSIYYSVDSNPLRLVFNGDSTEMVLKVSPKWTDSDCFEGVSLFIEEDFETKNYNADTKHLPFLSSINLYDTQYSTVEKFELFQNSYIHDKIEIQSSLALIITDTNANRLLLAFGMMGELVDIVFVENRINLILEQKSEITVLVRIA